jgi:predicted RNase H-like HicB family nuclease
MKAEHTAIIEAAEEGGYWATCPEVPGANGQGETVEEAKKSLWQAIEMLRGNLDDLLNQITPDNQHGEVRWGEPLGKETW